MSTRAHKASSATLQEDSRPSNGHAMPSKGGIEVLGVLQGRLFKAEPTKSWAPLGTGDVELTIVQKKGEPFLTFFLTVGSNGVEHVKQLLNTSLRIRLKEDVVQWQFKSAVMTDPVTHGFRCKTVDAAQQLETLLKDIRHNLEIEQKSTPYKKSSEEVMLKAYLPDNLSTKLSVPGSITMQGVFTLITARRRLDPECHEIRVQQGKYRAAVKPTLSIHSLGITEVHIIKVPRRAGAMGASRMLTVKLPNKMETYIQVKERKRVRDLYAYICEKKGLTPSAYKLSYSCKIEKEDDMDKTVAELDIWCVTLESVLEAKKREAKPVGREETDSGSPKTEAKPKRAAPPPPKKNQTPAVGKGVPLTGMAGKRIVPSDSTPPFSRAIRGTEQSSTHEQSNLARNRSCTANDMVVAAVTSTEELPRSDSMMSAPIPAGIEHSSRHKAVMKSASSSSLEGKGKPRRQAPPPPGARKKMADDSSAELDSRPQSSASESVAVVGHRSHSVAYGSITDASEGTIDVGRRRASAGADYVNIEKVPLPSNGNAPKFDDFDEINTYFNSVIAEADDHFKDISDDEFGIGPHSVKKDPIEQASQLGRSSPITSQRHAQEGLPSSSAVRRPIPRPRASPSSSPSRSRAVQPQPSPRKNCTTDTSPPLHQRVDAVSLSSAGSSAESSPAQRRLARQNNIVKDDSGKQLLIVYPSPGAKTANKKESLAFHIPPPPPMPQDSSTPKVTADEAETKQVDDEEDVDNARHESDSSDIENEEGTHYILGLTPSASFEQADGDPQGSESPTSQNRVREVTQVLKYADISASEMVTTSFSEDAADSEETLTTTDLPPPLPTPKASTTGDGTTTAGFFVPPPDEFEAPRPSLPTCSPPDLSDDEAVADLDAIGSGDTSKEYMTVQKREKEHGGEESEEDATKLNKRSSVHGSLITMISTLQGLLSPDGEDTMTTDFSKPLVESQGEASSGQEAVQPTSMEEGKGALQQGIPPPPPLPSVAKVPPKQLNQQPPSAELRGSPPPKLYKPVPPAVMKKPPKNSPKVTPKTYHKPSQQFSPDGAELELLNKLKERQKRIFDASQVEQKAAGVDPPIPQAPTADQPLSASVPLAAVEPGSVPPQTMLGNPLPQQVMGSQPIPPQQLSTLDPQQLLLQQQYLQQQLLQMQQLMSHLQASGAINSNNLPMLNPTLQGAGLPMAGNMQVGTNPGNPLLMGQPQVQGIAPVITTAGMMQPQLHGMTQSAVSQYPLMTPQPVVSHTTQQGSSAHHSNGHAHQSPLPPPSLVGTAQNVASKLRSERLGDIEMSFDQVMEEVRETNPMTILKKVHDPSVISKNGQGRRTSEMEDAVYHAMKDRRKQLERSRLSTEDDEGDLSWN